jgi:hypothetical protein
MGTWTFVVTTVQQSQQFGSQQGPGAVESMTMITAQPQDPNIIQSGLNPGDPLALTVRGTITSIPGTTFTITIP